MPILTCPKCPTKLKVPNGVTRNVKCPKCGTVFRVAAPSAPPPPAFELVEDEPPSLPTAQKTSAPLRPPKAATKAEQPDFEIIDDEEPPPKKKKAAVARREHAEDDFDDEEDRPRHKKLGKRRPRSDDDDDADDWRPRAAGGWGAAKVGMLLVSISLWMYLGTFAFLTFFLLIGWLGAVIPKSLMILLGLLGLANWIVALVGTSFCIAGPGRARGLAIAATVVAAVHLVLGFVVANNTKAGLLSTPSLRTLNAFNRMVNFTNLRKQMEKETDPGKIRQLQQQLEEYRDSGGDFPLAGLIPRDEMRWSDLATLSPTADWWLGHLIYNSEHFSDFILPTLAGFVEVARLILLILLVGSVAAAAKEPGLRQQALISAFIAGGATVAATIVLAIVMVILNETKPSKTPLGDTMTLGRQNWLVAGELITYLLHTAALILPAIVSLSVSIACGRRVLR